MPELRLVVASGTSQRRLLEETAKELEQKGYAMSARLEGGEWQPLLSDNMSGGLFDENRFIIVEEAESLGTLPEQFSPMVQKDSPVVIVLVYENEPSKLIPKEILGKCTVLKPAAYPRWPRERQQWVETLARNMNVALARDAAALMVELVEDPEEIRGQLVTLAALKGGKIVSAEDVENFCLDDGSKNLLRLLDGICSGDSTAAMKSLAAMEKTAQSGDLIKLTSALHNRFRLAFYGAVFPRMAEHFKNAFGARDYAWRLAQSAARRFGPRALFRFLVGILRLNAGEKSGTSNGWHELEFLVIELFGK
ncbi:MAG: hypothetical protein KBS54_03910 [Synergistaceae bacterium]|nr:hypothetical protein [Candidatus Equadaptatus faecalis]